MRQGNYLVTLHAEEEMIADDLNIFDIEEAILSGRVSHRQKDVVTGEWKYVIQGKSLEGISVVLAVKFGAGRKLVVITVYRVMPTNGKVR